jgi:hypothetical protein
MKFNDRNIYPASSAASIASYRASLNDDQLEEFDAAHAAHKIRAEEDAFISAMSEEEKNTFFEQLLDFDDEQQVDVTSATNEENEEKNTKFEQDNRRKIDRTGMIAKRLNLISTKKRHKIRTTTAINKRLESTEAMRLASDSAKGDLSGTIVYIDLQRHLPLTVTHPTKENHKYKNKFWRELSDQATVCIYQLASASIEAETNYVAVPFSWNLSEHLWQAAGASEQNDLTYLQHLLITTLKRTLNRTPDFWFAYEVAASANLTGKPHLHGTLLIEPSEAKRARQVFHQLNGEVSKDFKRHAIIFSSGKRKIRTAKYGALHANLAWPLYCMKERGTVRGQFLLDQKTFTATRGITQAATTYYDQIKPTKSVKKHKIRTDKVFGSWS